MVRLLTLHWSHVRVPRLLQLGTVMLCFAVTACRNDPMTAEADSLASLMALPDGAKVADVGAGDGRFTVELSRHLGRRVRITATELGRQSVLHLWRRANKAGAGNVSVAEGAASLFRTLRPGGRLFVIEQPLVHLESAPRDVPARRGGDGISPSRLDDPRCSPNPVPHGRQAARRSAASKLTRWPAAP